jgi:hypothetical protein
VCLHSCLYASIACPISWVYLILKSVFFFFFFNFYVGYIFCMLYDLVMAYGTALVYT